MAELDNLYKQWMAMQPLSSEKQRLLGQRFAVEYNFNSNHIEGNTLTYGQTELLLLFGKVVGGSDVKEYADMKASAVGVRMVQESVEDKTMPMTQNFIRQLHKVILREDYTVYRNLPGGYTTSYTIHAGQYKTRPNSVITRYGDRFVYASPEETPALMSDLVDWYNRAEQAGELSPVELAALFHYRYIRIHPFEDGNGRIARLLVNYILARHGWPMIVIRNRNKSQYLEALHKADLEVGEGPAIGANASLRQARHFVKYFSKTVENELLYFINFAQEQSTEVWWYDGQRITFRSHSTPKMLYAMRYDDVITLKSLAETAGINISAVKSQTSRLTQKGYIRRLEDGEWYVMICPSVELEE